METPVCFYGAISESKEQSFRLLILSVYADGFCFQSKTARMVFVSRKILFRFPKTILAPA